MNIALESQKVVSPGELRSPETVKTVDLNHRVGVVSKNVFIAIGALFCSAAYTACTFCAFSITSTLFTGLVVSAFMEGTIALFQFVKREKIDLKSLGVKAASVGTVSAANVADIGGVGIYAHELGHVAAAKACIKNCVTKVQVFPFIGGVTSFRYFGALTSFGKWLGERVSFILIASGGILATAAVSLLCFGVGKALKNPYPKLSEALTSFGIVRSANEVYYGLSSYKAIRKSLSHDFIYLSRVGRIPAYLPISMLVSVLTVGIYHYINQRLENKSS